MVTTGEGESERGRSEAPSATGWLGWILGAILCVLACTLAWQWLCVSTYRLYLDEKRAPEMLASRSARQRFDLAGDRVVPQIVSAEDERLSFPVGFARPSRLHLKVIPKNQATFEIALIEGGSRRVFSRQRVSGPTEISERLPATNGVLELANEGDLEWSDPRVVVGASVAPTVLGILGVLALLAIRGVRDSGGAVPARLPRTAWARTALMGIATGGITVGVCLVLLEAGLRILGDRLPSWIADQRTSLGEVHTDPRWQDSASYGPRLASHVNTFCAWQQGDIVRMGYLPPDLVRHPTYRFPFVTDANGFRNSEPQSMAEVVALGDSFTDGMTLPAEMTWPARLASRLGVSVRNYGTAGFGPGQELRALEEYALACRPRLVVVGFFAGNDLVDAERFEAFERGGGSIPSVGRGWKIKGVIARFDQLYLTSLYQGASAFLSDGRRGLKGRPARATGDDFSGEDSTVSRATGPAFDRGLFSIPVSGHVLRFALLPPYLNRLTLSRQQLEVSRGWELTRRAYREMHRLVRAQGAELIVLFIPSKSQVYLPQLLASFEATELRAALGYCLGSPEPQPELDTLMRNRLALNDLMREFCAEEGIRFLDLTEDLESRVRAGQNVYFPDDSHWNAAGHETAAAALDRVLGGDTLRPERDYASLR